jgi:hypothetical protein
MQSRPCSAGGSTDRPGSVVGLRVADRTKPRCLFAVLDTTLCLAASLPGTGQREAQAGLRDHLQETRSGAFGVGIEARRKVICEPYVVARMFVRAREVQKVDGALHRITTALL